MPTEITAAIILSILLVLFLLPNLKVVKENEALVIERLGSFLKVIDKPGIYWMIPLVDRVIQRESLLPITKTFSKLADDKESTYTYTYVITDIKMFCYTATEPQRVIEDKIRSLITYDEIDVEIIKEALLDYGINLQKINKINK